MLFKATPAALTAADDAPSRASHLQLIDDLNATHKPWQVLATHLNSRDNKSPLTTVTPALISNITQEAATNDARGFVPLFAALQRHGKAASISSLKVCGVANNLMAQLLCTPDRLEARDVLTPLMVQLADTAHAASPIQHAAYTRGLEQGVSSGNMSLTRVFDLMSALAPAHTKAKAVLHKKCQTNGQAGLF